MSSSNGDEELDKAEGLYQGARAVLAAAEGCDEKDADDDEDAEDENEAKEAFDDLDAAEEALLELEDEEVDAVDS